MHNSTSKAKQSKAKEIATAITTHRQPVTHTHTREHTQRPRRTVFTISTNLTAARSSGKARKNVVDNRCAPTKPPSHIVSAYQQTMNPRQSGFQILTHQ